VPTNQSKQSDAVACAGVCGPALFVTDPFDLQRFLDAQETTYSQALAELKNGCKESHWMWFIFPQIAGLGLSATSIRYAISGLPETRAYLGHKILGDRLRSCCEALLDLQGLSPEVVLGSIDAKKLRSSLTLFNEVSSESIFQDLLHKYYDGQADHATLELIAEIKS